MITIPLWLFVVLILLSTFFVILFIDEMVLRWKESKYTSTEVTEEYWDLG